MSTSYAIGKRRDWGRKSIEEVSDKSIEEVSDEMRAVIEDLWSELCTSLPPSRILALTWPSDPPAATACTGARQAVG